MVCMACILVGSWWSVVQQVAQQVGSKMMQYSLLRHSDCCALAGTEKLWRQCCDSKTAKRNSLGGTAATSCHFTLGHLTCTPLVSLCKCVTVLVTVYLIRWTGIADCLFYHREPFCHLCATCRAVIRLLPRLAAFAPERFAQDYLQKCIAHLLAVLKHTGERGSAFAALADMAGSLAAVGCQEGFEPYLPAIAGQVGYLLMCHPACAPVAAVL